MELQTGGKPISSQAQIIALSKENYLDTKEASDSWAKTSTLPT